MTTGCACALEEPPELGAPTVLLIDDDANTRMVLTAILDGRGLRILDAEGENSALARCRDAHTHIDVLVVDVMLQSVHGPELARSLRKLQPAARVLFISGFDLSELSRRGLLTAEDMRGGFVEYLRKPFDAATFASTVERLIGSDISLGRGSA